MIIICFNVKAENNCSKDELANLKELANNIEIKKSVHVDSYDDEESVYYTIDIVNYNIDLLVSYKINDDIYFLYQNDMDEIVFYEGDNITFSVYSFTENSCTNDLLRTIKVKFDYYNLYYYHNKDKCANYSDFSYCKEYLDKEEDLDDSLIEEKFNNYIEGLDIKSDSQNANNENSENNNLMYYVISGSVALLIIIIVIIIIVIRKRKKKEDW